MVTCMAMTTRMLTMAKNPFRPYAAEISWLRKRKEPKRLAKINPHLSEKQEQDIVVAWLRKNNILFYASANGGYRNLIEAANLKRQGVEPGVPDLCLPILKSPYGGLYIELKRKGKSVVSENQKKWIALLRANGQRAEICVGADEAISLIKSYLSML